ncbi:Yip1 family protein [Vacuolonema iberomarrocanum]|uniref:Yip1 family protein n=1 Tax=Vacuolonema iberomarrocanum TaxID=3454632 RepID=UPI001A0A5196|nr:CAAX protease [filamentous cyanobacterium LEGE 07170]
MPDSVLSRFWELIGWVFALNADAFRAIGDLPQGITLAVLIVLLAGFSQAIAQAIVLFLNQVTPWRFVLSLLLNALLFVAGFCFLVFSTWLITLLPWNASVSFSALFKGLGVSYAPLLFSFLGALPYLGISLLTGLSIWHLLALVVGFGAIANVGVGAAFGYVALGWIVLQVLQNTLGQPIANLGKRIANTVAGVELATSRKELVGVVRERAQQSATVWQEELREKITNVRQDGRPVTDLSSLPSSLERRTALSTTADTAVQASGSAQVVDSQRIDGTRVKTILALGGMVILTVCIVILLRPIREWLFGGYDEWPRLVRLIVNLVWISVVAIVVAGLLAPLETLGWWAGWYDDDIDTTINAGELAQSNARLQGGTVSALSRYIVYLDGIGKSTFEYLPDIEEFLDTLAPNLPEDVALVRGIMPYSVVNNPLDEDRPLSFLWEAADKARFANPAALLGLLVNLRNVLIVGVSADRRYGPLYNQGIAQVVYNGLVKNGYKLSSGTPITLIGYSGGGQMSCACAPYLKRALGAPIEVISLGGVISGNCNILQLEHLYHLVGEKDQVERIGPIMFPGRWTLFPLSYWNRAKRRGNLSIFSMGPVGHQVPGGILDPDVMLPDGHTALEQTIDYINQIIQGKLLPQPDLTSIKLSNYERYGQAPFTRPSYYPLHQTPPSNWYRAIAPWMGRLILPESEQRSSVRGVLFEVHHAPPEHPSLMGKTVILRWSQHPMVQRWVKAVTKDVHFSTEAEYSSIYGGLVHPDRLNHWKQVDPLESLAGSHPVDDIIVMLEGVVDVAITSPLVDLVVLTIQQEPIQITGRYYGLVRFVRPAAVDRYWVEHFNPETGDFDGGDEVVSLPPVIPDQNNLAPSSTQDLEKSPLNETGWYIYGALDRTNQFVVQSLAPRRLLQLQPDRVRFGQNAAYPYIRREAWADIRAQKGRIASVLCTARDDGNSAAIQTAIDQWQDGDRALLLHVYGGIGGDRREPAAATPIFFGHFAYGMATVIRDPLTQERRFDIRYYQIYTHNTDGLVAGTLHWSRYMGDRQFGWVGVRPVCDLLMHLDSLSRWYELDGERRSPINGIISQLVAMTARYRIGDGTGGTYVGPANNCSQDSNRAVFTALQRLSNQDNWLKDWADRHPQDSEALQNLLTVGQLLKLELQPLGSPRADWERNEYNLGTTLEDKPLQNLMAGISSWRTLLPRKASDTIVKVFLEHGASVWVLRTNQIGGSAPDIEPIAPMTF